MKEVLVLGIGNRLMMDDGIGVYLVEELNSRSTNPCIRYVVGETDINYCLQQIGDASHIVIVDAARLGGTPSDVRVLPLEQISGNINLSISIHESHFLDEIKRIGKNIKGIFIGIEPYEIDYNINLSTVLQDHFFLIVDDIKNIIETYVG